MIIFFRRTDRQLTSDLCLNQVVPLRADVFEESRDVDSVLVFYLLQHAVQDDVCTRPADACAAHQQERKNKMNPGFTDVMIKMKTKLSIRSYLQCTTIGPVSFILAPDDLRTKLSKGRAYSGTPMSGHWV